MTDPAPCKQKAEVTRERDTSAASGNPVFPVATEAVPPVGSGVCPPCLAGDHATHNPVLGGICVGCPCPASAPGPPSLSATAMSGAYTVGQVATLTVCVHGEVAAVRDGYVVIGSHVLPTRLSETVRVVSTDPPAPSVVVLDEWEDHDCGADHVSEEWRELARATHDDEHPHDAFPVCPHRLCRHARGA